MNDIKRLLQYNEKESKLFIPNELYEDLQNYIKKHHHIPFAFSYYYLISWLYRYAKYGNCQLDNKQLKQILGYSPTFPEIDYLIKKNGVLDLMGYTMTVKDLPISWSFDNGLLEFTMLSDMDEFIQKILKENMSRKYSIKFPVKSFYRYVKDEEMKEEYDKSYEDGTFFDFEHIHLVPFEVFLFSMNKKEIGCTGFYIWSYLKCQNQIHDGGYDISIIDLSEKINIPRSTLCNYMGALRKYKMVSCFHNQKFFCLALKENERKSNTYVTNKFEQFSDEPIEYEKMEVIRVEDYIKLLESEEVGL